jgi:hypothetical protein
MIVIRTENGLPIVMELVHGQPQQIDSERWSEILGNHELDDSASIPVAVDLRNIVIEMVQTLAKSPL